MTTIQSPLALTEDLVDAYRLVMTKVDANDWPGLQRRVAAAEALARKAFVDEDRGAWEVVQVVEWRLQRDHHLRPTDPSDVLALSTLYRVEEESLPAIRLDAALSAREFGERLTNDAAQYSAVQSPTLALMESGTLTKEDWHYFAHQWLAPTTDFCRMIAVASLPLPPEFARSMYQNLYDEAGRGVWERTHHYLLHKFLHYFDVDTKDPDTVFRWVTPEMVAMINEQNRLLFHPEAAWSLGSMYLYEMLLPNELERVRNGLQKSGTPPDVLEWFDEHIVVDVEHAEEWLEVVELFLVDRRDQEIAYRAAMERGKWAQRGWDTMLPAWEQWKLSGVPPHLPGLELQKAAGV